MEASLLLWLLTAGLASNLPGFEGDASRSPFLVAASDAPLPRLLPLSLLLWLLALAPFELAVCGGGGGGGGVVTEVLLLLADTTCGGMSR